MPPNAGSSESFICLWRDRRGGTISVTPWNAAWQPQREEGRTTPSASPSQEPGAGTLGPPPIPGRGPNARVPPGRVARPLSRSILPLPGDRQGPVGHAESHWFTVGHQTWVFLVPTWKWPFPPLITKVINEHFKFFMKQRLETEEAKTNVSLSVCVCLYLTYLFQLWTSPPRLTYIDLYPKLWCLSLTPFCGYVSPKAKGGWLISSCFCFHKLCCI